jgi:hypothetical protein
VNKNFLLVILSALSVMLGGCASTPWTASYEGPTDFRSIRGYSAGQGAATIHPSSNLHRDRRELNRQGYAQLGTTSFNGASPPTAAQLAAFADQLGAHKVLYNPVYLKVAVDASPIVLPHDTPSSNYVPAPLNYAPIAAVFMAKLTTRVGLSMVQLDDATKRRMGTDQALIIDTVVDGSPAHRSDVRPGDILLSVDGRPLRVEAGGDNFGHIVAGQSFVMKLRRGDDTIDKRITLN